jgi:hypothetical protein
MTDLQREPARAAGAIQRRPPAGVVVIAAVCALSAGASAIVAVTLLLVPDMFPSSGGSAVWRGVLAVAALAFAVFLAVVCYDLLRLHDFARRAAVILSVLQALGRLPALMSALIDSGAFAAADEIASMAIAVAAAVYLTRPHVKRAFGADPRPSSPT